MSDEDVPVPYRPAGQPSTETTSSGALPRKSGLRARMDTWEAEQNLKFERVEVERVENATRMTEAKTTLALRYHELQTVDEDKKAIDARREADLATTQAATKQAMTAADSEMSNLLAIKEENEARKEEATNRKLQAQLANKALQAKLNGGAGDQDAKIAALKQQQLEAMLALQELEDELNNLENAAASGDPAVAAKKRLKQLERTQQLEEVDRIRKRLDQLYADL